MPQFRLIYFGLESTSIVFIEKNVNVNISYNLIKTHANISVTIFNGSAETVSFMRYCSSPE